MAEVDWSATVDPARLRATVERLAAFHTRNTLSPTVHEAAAWLATELKSIRGVDVELMRYTLPQGPRVPEEREAVQVVAALPGRSRTSILVGGHLDSLQAGADPATARAPGANDDATGVAAALEAMRALSTRKWQNTIIFAAVTGEEQGLLGSKALALRCRAEWAPIVAVLMNDTVGSTRGHSVRADRAKIRLFSEEFVGGDAPSHESRELARYIEWVARGIPGFGVKLVFRPDRYGRGGDHTPFVKEGFSAVRFTEAYEDYARQHTVDDVPERIDWHYLANVARVNVRAMASLAAAGPAPTEVEVDRSQGYDTTLKWGATPGVSYAVYVRETTSPVWECSFAAGGVSKWTVEGLNKDDHVFAVGAVGGVPVVAK